MFELFACIKLLCHNKMKKNNNTTLSVDRISIPFLFTLDICVSMVYLHYKRVHVSVGNKM